MLTQTQVQRYSTESGLRDIPLEGKRRKEDLFAFQ